MLTLTSNRAIFMLDGVNGVDTLENMYSIGLLTGSSQPQWQDAFVTHILQRDNLAGDLFLRQLFAGDMAVSRDMDSKHSRSHSSLTDTAAQT